MKNGKTKIYNEKKDKSTKGRKGGQNQLAGLSERTLVIKSLPIKAPFFNTAASGRRFPNFKDLKSL